MLRRVLCVLACALVLGAAPRAVGEKEDVVVPEIVIETEYSIPDTEGLRFARSLGVGWSLGNTLDAYADGFSGDELDTETLWCGVRTSPEMLQAVADAGFSTVRLPVTWHPHVSGEDFVISEAWLARVQQIVDDALAAGLKVIVNTHHDVGFDTYYPTREYAEVSLRYVRRVWGQIAGRFRDYDERLIFEGLNEPRLKDTRWEWNFDGRVAEYREAAECINAMNQAFVDAVRGAGGRNAARWLMVTPYAATPDGAVSDCFRLPTDSAEGRLMVSAHAYTPYSFALDVKGTPHFNLKNGNQTGEIDRFMDKLYQRFVANGVPVVLGEFGALDKDGNTQARVDFAAYYVASASARGMPCLWWDNHAFTGDGERFGLLRRRVGKWMWKEIVEAMVEYGME